MSPQDCCNQNCRQGRDCPQRAELLAALKSLTTAADNATAARTAGGEQIALVRLFAPIRAARAAIAKATGTTP